MEERDLLKIKLNDSNEIEAYAIIGDLDGSIPIQMEKMPDDFVDNFQPSYYVYNNGEILKNESYKEEDYDYKETPPRFTILQNMIIQQSEQILALQSELNTVKGVE